MKHTSLFVFCSFVFDTSQDLFIIHCMESDIKCTIMFILSTYSWLIKLNTAIDSMLFVSLFSHQDEIYSFQHPHLGSNELNIILLCLSQLSCLLLAQRSSSKIFSEASDHTAKCASRLFSSLCFESARKRPPKLVRVNNVENSSNQ